MAKKQYTEQEGVAAIKFLQNLGNVPETDEQALRGWRSMSAREKESTMNVYASLKDTDNAKEIVESMITQSPEAQQRRQNDLDRNKREKKK